MSHIGTRPPSGVNESCIELTEPFEAAVVAVAQSAEFAMPKRVSLPSMLPPGCSRRGRLVDAERVEARIAGLLGGERADHQRHEDHQHRDEHRPALARVLDHAPERVAERRRDQQDRQHLEEVRERRRILERMRRVDVEEAAAVRAELLDRDLARGRAERQRLLRDCLGLHDGLAGGVELRRAVRVRGRHLDRPRARRASPSGTARRSARRPATQHDRQDERQRQQDVERCCA